MSHLSSGLLIGALFASLSVNGLLWREQRVELAGLRYQLREQSIELDRERTTPRTEGMGWSRQDQNLAAAIAAQVRAELPRPACSGAADPTGALAAPVGPPPAPRAELPPGASDVGDTQPTAAEQAAYDEAEALVDDVIARGTLTEHDAEAISALRQQNGNRPEFFKLRERMIVAANQQKLKIVSDSPQTYIP